MIKKYIISALNYFIITLGCKLLHLQITDGEGVLLILFLFIGYDIEQLLGFTYEKTKPSI